MRVGAVFDGAQQVTEGEVLVVVKVLFREQQQRMLFKQGPDRRVQAIRRDVAKIDIVHLHAKLGMQRRRLQAGHLLAHRPARAE